MSGSDEEKQSERDVQQAIAIASASKEQDFSTLGVCVCVGEK